MNTKTAVLAGGCFWGMEDLFRKQKGVVDTETGYTGGSNEHPTYQSHPGHAEALKVTYNPAKTSYPELLDFFFRIHDPTTMNRQGNDTGSAYRSAIFYGSEEEKKEAERLIDLVNKSKNWSDPVVTTLEAFGAFTPAEPEHQDYLQSNPGGYTCHFVRNVPSYLA